MQRDPPYWGVLVLMGASACVRYGGTSEPTTIEDEAAKLEDTSHTPRPRAIPAPTDREPIASSGDASAERIEGVGPPLSGEGQISMGQATLIGDVDGDGTVRYRRRDSKVPRVRHGKAEITGRCDEDHVRRVIRAHVNEVRYCYARGLVEDPDLSGDLSVRFVIGPGGKVHEAEVARTTLEDGVVAPCIVTAVAGWTFSTSMEEDVTVTYPFMFELR